MDKKEVLIEVKDLKKYFQVGRNQTLKAVDGVNFKIYKGETLGIVGESGCGKTTCGKTVMGLYKATDGEVLFDGVDINKLNKKEKKEFTKRAQIIFQDPYSSLNPRMTSLGKELISISFTLVKNVEKRFMNYWNWSDLTESMHFVSLMSFRVDKDSVSELQEHLQSNRNLLSVMSQSLHLTFPFRHRLLTC